MVFLDLRILVGGLAVRLNVFYRYLLEKFLRGINGHGGDLYYRLRSEYSTGCTSVGMEGLINELATMFSDNEGGQ